MVDLMPAQTVLTPADAANQLQTQGLDALGLAVPVLSSGWSSTAPGAVDDDKLRLTLSGPLAPFKAILRLDSDPVVWSTVSGAPIGGPVAVLELHPEAARRLATLVTARLGSPLLRPVPVAMVVHGVTLPAAPDPLDWVQAGEFLGFAGPHDVSFHDARGLPIDPIAVAALFADLIGWRPALSFGDAAMPALASAGGLIAVTGLAGTSAARCHVIDPHGNAYVPPRPEATLKVINAGGDEIAAVPASGLVTLATGQRLGRATTDNAADLAAGTPLQWGFAPNGFLDRLPLPVPALPAGVNLVRQFFRVIATDLDWHLLGNRTSGTVQGVPGDDGTVPDFALPLVRHRVPGFDYLIDGMDVLGAAGQMSAGFPPAGADVLALLCSPAIDPALAIPPTPGAPGHWPAFPPGPGTTLPPASDPTAGATAGWRSPADALRANRDVIVTLASDVVPAGTHLRVFPRRFVQIDAIGEQPSFVRGDGGAGIAQPGQATKVLLTNPFALAPAEPLPSPGTLSVDIVAVGRDGTRRLCSAVKLTIGAASPWIDNTAQFGGTALLTTPLMAALTAAFGVTSVAPASLFGITAPPVPAGPAPAGIIDLVRRLANETTAPRQGPHLPTQGRFDSILALGAALAAGAPLAWQAVLSGARWTWESRSAQPEFGDPGNPSGPDVHAAGVRVAGQLAYDLALHTLKRAQPIIPMSATTPGWIVVTGGDNWNLPAPDQTGTVAAAMLETVAPFVDSPELSFVPVPQPGDTIQNAINSLAGTLGVPAPAITIANETRLRTELQREIVTAKSGQRDALWSLMRAIDQAREYIYLESPMFARTGRDGGIDLVDLIRARLAANPRLKVMICLPRNPDYDAAKANWVRAALKHRKEAIEALTGPFRTRVAAFSPIGFPGRPTAIRTTVVLVDDVFCLVGTSHFRRRGMTFDGGTDVVSIDRTLDARGTSAGIARFRQESIARKLGVTIPAGPAQSSALWTRLAQPESAFAALAELLSSGGQGRCSPIWAGPTDTTVIPQSDALADPNGIDPTGTTLLSLFGSLLLEA